MHWHGKLGTVIYALGLVTLLTGVQLYIEPRKLLTVPTLSQLITCNRTSRPCCDNLCVGIGDGILCDAVRVDCQRRRPDSHTKSQNGEGGRRQCGRIPTRGTASAVSDDRLTPRSSALEQDVKF